MRRKLTVSQRQALIKLTSLTVAVLMFAGTMIAIPFAVRNIPKLSGVTTRNLLSGTRARAVATPVFALGGGDDGEESSPPPEEPDEIQPPETPEEPVEPAPTPREGDLFVTESNLCWYEIGETAVLNLNNRTSFNVDINDYISREFPIEGTITNEPLVLIVHTHGSESYLKRGYDFYSPDDDFRSATESETVVHIGSLLCEKLNSLGIPTVQDKTMHDLPNYNQSYNNSLAAIKEYLNKYPSIKFVIDLHRDSVFDSAGNNIKPVTQIDGKNCAQLMLVMGTNELGIPHPNWRDNLTFAAHLQAEMNQTYPTLARPINLRTAEFNQAQTKGSIILEVGSCGNNIEEAENAVDLFANVYSKLLLEYLG